MTLLSPHTHLRHNPTHNRRLAQAADRTGGGQTPRRLKVAQFGLGLIGIEAAKLAATKPWLEVVAGIDVDPAKSRGNLARLTGQPGMERARVFSTFEQMLEQVRPDVVLHTAGSKLGEALEQIEPMVRRGVHVVSSCEELLYPQLRDSERASRMDELCRQCGAGVVGTGVNPGFVMDLLPICLTGVSRVVEAIRVQRVVNASTRRMQLQKKIGSGMDPAAFGELFRAGKAGHAGFRESAALICHCMGWPVDHLAETCEPIAADHEILTDFFAVKMGQTCGLHQVVRAEVDGVVKLEMDLKMYLDAVDPHDAVQVMGDPPLNMRLNGGVAGDSATVAALVNAVPRVLRAGPGLHLMTDLAVPAWH